MDAHGLSRQGWTISAIARHLARAWHAPSAQAPPVQASCWPLAALAAAPVGLVRRLRRRRLLGVGVLDGDICRDAPAVRDVHAVLIRPCSNC